MNKLNCTISGGFPDGMTPAARVDQASGQILAQVISGTVAFVGSSFMVDCRARSLSKNTLKAYDDEIRVLLRWLDAQGVVKIEELTADVIRKYLLHLAERRNPGGQFAAYRVIRQMTYWWERETDDEYRSPIRKVKPTKVPEEPLEPIDKAALKALLATCEPNYTGRRDKALIYVLLDTGLRASECLSILACDVDLVNGSILIRSGKGGKPRTVYFGKETRRMLKPYLAARSGQTHLWLTDDGEELTYAGLRQVMRRRSAAAGIKPVTLHAFRRTFAITALRAGVDLVSLSRLLGHADLTVIKRYLKQDTTDLEEAHRRGSPVGKLL